MLLESKQAPSGQKLYWCFSLSLHVTIELVQWVKSRTTMNLENCILGIDVSKYDFKVPMQILAYWKNFFCLIAQIIVKIIPSF